ncbi:MAG TPA: non-homologous end-joining DNA ligase [Kofleriaceae bacterium]|nr:non-homologous end-joining DNA ligase [Kofleriaceae bacterium]
MNLPDALQLATLSAEAPAGDAWLHEQKFDGYRILAVKDATRVRLLSRRFNDWTTKFQAIADAVGKLPAKELAIDGEVCVLAPDGRTSFQALQNADARDAALVYFAFDLLAVDGDDIAARPLEQRKQRLARLVAGNHTIRYSDHVIGNGAAAFDNACKLGLEGIVSKRRDQRYAPGRSKIWLKTKCIARQELVIGGYTDPDGARTGIGAVLVGYYARKQLRYAGKVGTGFSTAMLATLRKQLEPLERATSPFDPEPQRAWTGPRTHWVEPRLVAEVAFSEWTEDGRLRHPSFQGLRADKRPRDVVREAVSR